MSCAVVCCRCFPLSSRFLAEANVGPPLPADHTSKLTRSELGEALELPETMATASALGPLPRGHLLIGQLLVLRSASRRPRGHSSIADATLYKRIS